MVKRAPEQFAEFEQIQERLAKARRLLGGFPGSPSFCAPYMEPPVDVYQTEGEVVVLMEIAGIPEEQIELHVDGQRLVITGERKPLRGPAERRYSQLEIAHGAFQREIFVPTPVNPEDSTAVYKDGILKIVFPKAPSAGGMHLRIVVR